MNNLLLSTFTVSKFPKGYGRFPYLIVRVGNGLCRQIPIHLNHGSTSMEELPGVHLNDVEEGERNSLGIGEESLLHYRLLELAKKVKRDLEKEGKKAVRICLVEGKNTAYYFELDEIIFSSSIPSKETLLSFDNQIIAMRVNHYISENLS